MPKGKINWGKIGAITGLISIIIACILGAKELGLFDKPQMSVSYVSEIIGVSNPYFQINLRNIGNKNTNICVNVSSDNKNLTFQKTQTCSFLEKQTPLDLYYTFKFDINKTFFEKPNGNFTVNISLAYEKFNYPLSYHFEESCSPSGFLNCNYNRIST